MKQTLNASAVALTLTLLSQNVLAEGKLSLYHWFEYIPQAMLDRFAAENDIEVTMDTYDSNESMLATLKAGSMGTYDLAVPSDYMVSIMAGAGMLDNVADGELANKGNIAPEWADPSFDPGRQYSVPYQWGSTAFSVDTAKYKGDINTTDIIFNPPEELSGKINVIDSQGEVIALASLHMGIPQCSTDRDQLIALNQMLQNAKPHWASFNSDTAKEVLVSGDVVAGMIFDGFSAKARAELSTLQYAFPIQGYIAWMDNVVLLKDAPNRGNALKFMDFMLEPKNIAEVSNFARYNNAIPASAEFLDADLVSQPESNPPAEAGEPVFVQVCDETTQTVYDKIWTNLKK